MNFFIYWQRNMNICIGELSMLIPCENKIWTLNQDKTISPSNHLDIVIGVAEVGQFH